MKEIALEKTSKNLNTRLRMGPCPSLSGKVIQILDLLNNNEEYIIKSDFLVGKMNQLSYTKSIISSPNGSDVSTGHKKMIRKYWSISETDMVFYGQSIFKKK